MVNTYKIVTALFILSFMIGAVMGTVMENWATNLDNLAQNVVDSYGENSLKDTLSSAQSNMEQSEKLESSAWDAQLTQKNVLKILWDGLNPFSTYTKDLYNDPNLESASEKTIMLILSLFRTALLLYMGVLLYQLVFNKKND